MAESHDNNDCWSPQEWYEQTQSMPLRSLYFKVNYVKRTEGDIDRQSHYVNIEETNTSYRVEIKQQKCFWTNTPQDNVSIAMLGNGYWTEEFHYDPNYDSSLSAVCFIGLAIGSKCKSSTGTGSVSTSNWNGLEGYDCCVIGPLTRTRNAKGAVTVVSGDGVTVLRKNRSSGVISEYWADTDNGKDGTYSGGAHVTETYYVTAIIYDVDTNSEVPDIFEAATPTEHAWYREQDLDWIELGDNPLTSQVEYDQELRNRASWYMDEHGNIKADIVPHTLEWAFPYPYGKWYRDSDGTLKTRGLPDALIDTQGAFSGVSTLREVVIPDTVESIGRYSFHGTSLREVELPENCTYYSTSFPPDCEITGGQLIDN